MVVVVEMQGCGVVAAIVPLDGKIENERKDCVSVGCCGGAAMKMIGMRLNLTMDLKEEDDYCLNKKALNCCFLLLKMIKMMILNVNHLLLLLLLKKVY